MVADVVVVVVVVALCMQRMRSVMQCIGVLRRMCSMGVVGIACLFLYCVYTSVCVFDVW